MDKKKYYKKIFGYFKHEKLTILLYLVTSLLIVAVSTISPAISAKSLNAITNVELDKMIFLGLLTMVIEACSIVLNYINSRCSRKIHNRVSLKIKEDVSSELFDLEMKNFDKEGTGFFANRIDDEPRVLAGIFTRVRYSVTSIFTSIGVFVYIFYVCPIIGAFLLCLSLINFFINMHRIKVWEKYRKKNNEMYEKYSSNFGELIRGIKDIKVLNLKRYLIKKTKKEQKEIIEFEEMMDDKNQLWNIATNILRLIMNFVFIALGVWLINIGNITGATFLVLYMYKGRASYFLEDISSMYETYKNFNMSLERLYEVVDGIKYPKEKFGKKEIDVQGNIEFKNVTFGYEENDVLKNIDFSIKKNETIGIVGKSGVGKSTILNLINKLYTVKDGEIFIDGVNIDEISEKTLRGSITTITQNPYIFNMSIRDNIKIVSPDATDEEILEKCKQCALDEYIGSLDNGLDTVVGENGVILSGGLKQRLAIARAILKDSKILLLDEATSSLDNETQDHIHHSIKKLRNDFTIIIIAHRLSTVIDCDKIIVVEDGRIVGFDTHENLIQNNNSYKKLYKKELV